MWNLLKVNNKETSYYSLLFAGSHYEDLCIANAAFSLAKKFLMTTQKLE